MKPTRKKSRRRKPSNVAARARRRGNRPWAKTNWVLTALILETLVLIGVTIWLLVSPTAAKLALEAASVVVHIATLTAAAHR